MPRFANFGALLTWLIAQRGLTQSEFARRVGRAPAVIHFIRTGRRRPPLEMLPQWAEALDLSADERALFDELALLEHAPDGLRALVDNLHRAAGHHDHRQLTTPRAAESSVAYRPGKNPRRGGV